MVIATTATETAAAAAITGSADSAGQKTAATRSASNQTGVIMHGTCGRKLSGFPSICGQPAVARIVPGSGYPAWLACAEHAAGIPALQGREITEAEHRYAVSDDGEVTV